ncbi:MAG: tRNA pseudouridine(38-40) synthase TruA [Phycisphaerae bacterium]|nr:tRNA pseudouridine(38-40) synthase TruA [Phycisphaerae bacterium]
MCDTNDNSESESTRAIDQNSRKVKLIVAYDGTCYHGWQRQLDGVDTVQERVEDAIEAVVKPFKNQLYDGKVSVRCAGRTDTGVHSRGQVVTFRTNCPIPTGRLYQVINNHLPMDIRITSARDVPEKFDATTSSRRKLYRYTVYNRRLDLPNIPRFAYYCPPYCDVERMKAGAKCLLGRHDFKSFAASSDQRKTTVRTLYRCDIRRHYHYIYFELEGSGFLHHMVRNIVGTLLDVGRGHFTPEQVVEILAARDRRAAGTMAPANGLCMQWVQY